MQYFTTKPEVVLSPSGERAQEALEELDRGAPEQKWADGTVWGWANWVIAIGCLLLCLYGIHLFALTWATPFTFWHTLGFAALVVVAVVMFFALAWFIYELADDALARQHEHNLRKWRDAARPKARQLLQEFSGLEEELRQVSGRRDPNKEPEPLCASRIRSRLRAYGVHIQTS